MSTHRTFDAICVVVLLLTLLSLFVPIVYSIDERNVYARRPVGYVYYFAILYYCFSAWRVTKRYEKENGAMAFFNIHMFLIPIVLGIGLQFLWWTPITASTSIMCFRPGKRGDGPSRA